MGMPGINERKIHRKLKEKSKVCWNGKIRKIFKFVSVVTSFPEQINQTFFPKIKFNNLNKQPSISSIQHYIYSQCHTSSTPDITIQLKTFNEKPSIQLIFTS